MWDKNVPAAVFMRGWILAAAIAVVKKRSGRTKEEKREHLWIKGT